MKLTVLGAGTVLPAARRSQAGHLLEFYGHRFLFDIGAGTVARLQATGRSYLDLDAVLVSHLHPDHVLDLVTLLQANNGGGAWTRRRPLRVAGCPGLGAFVEAIVPLFDGAAPEDYQLVVEELPPGRRHAFGDTVIETAFTGHTPNSIAFRLEAEGRTFVYSGDAAESPALGALARDADLFLCESTFPRGYRTSDHLTADAAGRIAAAARVRHLVLCHTHPDTDPVAVAEEARAEYGGPVTVAFDGTEVGL